MLDLIAQSRLERSLTKGAFLAFAIVACSNESSSPIPDEPSAMMDSEQQPSGGLATDTPASGAENELDVTPKPSHSANSDSSDSSDVVPAIPPTITSPSDTPTLPSPSPTTDATEEQPPAGSIDDVSEVDDGPSLPSGSGGMSSTSPSTSIGGAGGVPAGGEPSNPMESGGGGGVDDPGNGGSSGVGAAGGSGGMGGSTAVEPADPEPLIECPTVNPRLQGITIHSIDVLDPLGNPVTEFTEAVWTDSPISLRIEVSARGLAAGETVDVPVSVGVVPAGDADGEYLCLIDGIVLEGLTGTERSTQTFRYVVVPDACFAPGSPFMNRLSWTSRAGFEPSDGYYPVNLALLPDPACEVAEEEAAPIIYTAPLATALPNAQCASSTTGAGCVWNVPVAFCTGCLDVRQESLVLESSVGTVPATTLEASDEFVRPVADATMTLLAFGRETNLDGPVPAPGNSALVIEYWLNSNGATGTGDRLLIAVDGSESWRELENDVRLTEFIAVNRPVEYHHSLYLSESTRAKLTTGGVWGSVTGFVITGCIRSNTASAPLEEDCRRVNVVLEREPPAVSPAPVQSDPLVLGRAPWQRTLGATGTAQLHVYATTWNQLVRFPASATSDNRLYAHAVALGGHLSKVLVDANINGRLDVGPWGVSQVDVRLDVMGDTVFSQNYEGGTPSTTQSRSISYCVAPEPYVYVGPVRVAIRLCATGNAGFTMTSVAERFSGPGPIPLNNAATNGRLYVSATPYTNVGLSGQVSAKFVVVEAGISGNITLIEARLPVNASVEWGTDNSQSNTIDGLISGRLDLELLALRGKISGYAKVGLCPFCSTHRKDIMSFSGSKTKYPLLNRSTGLVTLQ